MKLTPSIITYRQAKRQNFNPWKPAIVGLFILFTYLMGECLK